MNDLVTFKIEVDCDKIKNSNLNLHIELLFAEYHPARNLEPSKDYTKVASTNYKINYPLDISELITITFDERYSCCTTA